MRKIAVVVNSRANYARIKSVLRAIDSHDELELCLIVGASAVLSRFGDLLDIIKHDGFHPVAEVYSMVEGSTPIAMAKSVGLTTIELASLFENLKPDLVLTIADRFETLATAIAASYMNIPLAHTQGGEVTGSIDESVRHAITKLAHIHFPATKQAERYILKMGENPDNVHLTGCPAMDLAKAANKSRPDRAFFDQHKGSGVAINPDKAYFVVVQHPDTTEYEKSYHMTECLLTVIEKLKVQVCWLWPNIDAGSDLISKTLRKYQKENNCIHFYRNFPPEDYIRLIANCACLIGNSSSGIREGAFLGTPVVDIGDRQHYRERANNVLHSNNDIYEILGAIKTIRGREIIPSYRFGKGDAGTHIVEKLAEFNLDTKKTLMFRHEHYYTIGKETRL